MRGPLCSGPALQLAPALPRSDSQSCHQRSPPPSMYRGCARQNIKFKIVEGLRFNRQGPWTLCGGKEARVPERIYQRLLQARTLTKKNGCPHRHPIVVRLWENTDVSSLHWILEQNLDLKTNVILDSSLNISPRTVADLCILI